MSQLAIVFPGQGSQSIGMLSQLAEQYPIIVNTFNLVSEQLGYDLWQLTQMGPENQLNQTENTQVIMLTANVALFRLLKSLGFAEFSYMAGHSLGEYAALVCANSISLVDAANLVLKRAQLMQKAVPVGLGAMAAIVGLTNEQVEKICQDSSTEKNCVTPANFNAIGQVVIAGHTDAVNKAIKLAEQHDARLAKIIPVSVPCHCPLLAEIALEFSESLNNANFKTPENAVISNVDLSIYQSVLQIRQLLKEQLFKPVRWVETIQLIASKQITNFIECGPNKVLNGLNKRIDKSLVTLNVNDPASVDHLLAQFKNYRNIAIKEFE